MSNSWIHLKDQEPKFQLTDKNRLGDLINAADCGWVEQMTPFVKQFSKPGELVLDPFCGFGSTLIAAELEGRRSIGIEIDAKRVETSKERLSSLGFRESVVIEGDAQKNVASIKSVDLILSNIPYFGCAWGKYDSDQLYSSSSYEEYLQKLRACLKEFKKTLKYSGYIIFAVQNIRLGNHFVPLAKDILALLSESFHFIDERILIYDKPASNPIDVISDRAHEFLFIAQNVEKPIDLLKSKKYLFELNKLYPEIIVYGSFAAWILSSETKPSDVDVFLPNDASLIKSVTEWFMLNGFKVTRWGVPLDHESINHAISEAQYFRAERLDVQGTLVRFDISFSDKSYLYNEMVSKSVMKNNIRCVNIPISF